MGFWSNLFGKKEHKQPQFLDSAAADLPGKAGKFTSRRALLKRAEMMLKDMHIKESLTGTHNDTEVYDLRQTLRLIATWVQHCCKKPISSVLKEGDKIQQLQFMPWISQNEFQIAVEASVVNRQGYSFLTQVGEWKIHVVRAGINQYRGYLLDRCGWRNDLRASLGKEVSLHEAVKRNDHKALRIALVYLSKTRGSPNTYHGVHGNTALHYAVENGCLECVKMLLDSGANPNGDNEPGYDMDTGLAWRKITPFEMAMTGDERLIEALVLGGADVNAKNHEPMKTAISMGSVAKVKLLLNHGARVDKSLILEAESAFAKYDEAYYRRYPGVRYVGPEHRRQIIKMLKEEYHERHSSLT